MPERVSSNSAAYPESDGIHSLRSAIYKGFVWHQRYQPAQHKFRYQVFMMYLDLAEQHAVLGSSPFWGDKWYHVARFKRTDYFSVDNDYSLSIDASVRQEVKRLIDVDVRGPVCLLTNFRYFGHNTNPISCYYCFNADATALIAMLIEVTNTPWGEKNHYVLDLRDYQDKDAIDFEKKMHVSPFMPMNRLYRWRGSVPAQTLRYSLASVSKDEKQATCDSKSEIQFDSGVVFTRVSISNHSLNKTLFCYPFMTVKVILAIYWQALRLWFKKVPFVAHPSKSSPPLKTQS